MPRVRSKTLSLSSRCSRAERSIRSSSSSRRTEPLASSGRSDSTWSGLDSTVGADSRQAAGGKVGSASFGRRQRFAFVTARTGLLLVTLRRDLLQAEKKAIRLNPNEQGRPCSFVPEHVHSFVPIRSFPFPNSLASWLVPTMEALRSQARD